MSDCCAICLAWDPATRICRVKREMKAASFWCKEFWCDKSRPEPPEPPAQPQFNLQASIAARDEALDRIAAKSDTFMPNGIIAITNLPGGEYTGEAIRDRLTAAGIVPHHHNAWGALVASAIKHGLLIATGRWIPMQDVRSHARKTQVYERRRNAA